MVNFTTYGFKLCGKSVKDRIEKHYNKSRILTIGRTANLTVPHKGREVVSIVIFSRGCIWRLF
jgi:hypothetical protein